jgi:hypothetical protein
VTKKVVSLCAFCAQVNAMGGSGKKLKETTVNRYINLLKLPIIKRIFLDL